MIRSLTLCIAITAILFFSSYDFAPNKDVDLLGLANQDFKFIVKIDNATNAEEIVNAESYLKQFDPSISILRIVKNDGEVSMKIKSKSAKCESSNFDFGMISIDKNNKCRCAVGEKGK